LQREIIESLAKSKAKEYRLVSRAQMILELADGANNKEVARLARTNRHSVRLWRQRWIEASPQLTRAEQEGVEQQHVAPFIEQILSDLDRRGAPPKFTPEQIVQIVAVACERPAESGRPISQWTPRELAEEVMKRKIVASISTRSVGRFLKGRRVTTTSR
jgi:putative transposase